MSDEYVEGSVPIPEKTNIVEKVISAAKSFASKGLDNKYCGENTKSLRIFSCHGDGKLPPCPYRVESTNHKDSYYCGACGCGDKKFTQLINYIDENNEKVYSKLDFPVVTCPLHMPGFSNYTPNKDDSPENKNSRKIYLENTRGVGYIMSNSITKESKNDENNATESEQPNEQPNPNSENQQSND